MSGDWNAKGSMTYAHLEGWWTDAGTFDSLLRAGNLVAGSRQRSGSTEGDLSPVSASGSAESL